MPSKSVLSGDLGSFGLADVFTLLGMGKKTGVLRLTRGAETRTLHWEAGEIVFARSNSVRDSLGNFLVRKGMITAEQNAVSASKIDETTRHGKVLVRMGFITADQLLWAVKQQVLEIIYSLFHWRSGFFEFSEGEVESKEKITLSMSTTKIVMEGIHRLDEWASTSAPSAPCASAGLPRPRVEPPASLPGSPHRTAPVSAPAAPQNGSRATSATHSTWCVCGKRSTGVTDTSRNPPVSTRIRRSLARVAGSHET